MSHPVVLKKIGKDLDLLKKRKDPAYIKAEKELREVMLKIKKTWIPKRKLKKVI